MKKLSLYFCIFFILNSTVIFIKGEDDGPVIHDDQLLAKDEVEQLFQKNIKKFVKNGKLKKLWNKFLQDGVHENINNNNDEDDDITHGYKKSKKTSNTAQLLHTVSSIGLKISKEILRNLTKREVVQSVEVLKGIQAPDQFCPFLQVYFLKSL